MGGFMFHGEKGSAEQADPALKFHASGFQGTRLDGKAGALVFAGAFLVMVVGGEARGMTAIGALLTNFASATLTTINAHPYEAENAATAAVYVLEPPVIAMTKMATPTMGAPGNVVTYTLCAQNLSWSLSAFNITIRDVLPDNMAYVSIPNGAPDPWDNAWGWFTPDDGASWTRSYSGVPAGPYLGGEPVAGQGGPYYLRWVATRFGPRKSGCVKFAVSIR